MRIVWAFGILVSVAIWESSGNIKSGEAAGAGPVFSDSVVQYAYYEKEKEKRE